MLNGGVPPTRAVYLRAGRLTTDTQALNQVFVSFRVTAFQVLQKAPPPSDHRQQSPAGMMILAVRLEMIHELQNTLAKDRYLNLWRTGVGLVGSVLCDYFIFGIGRQCHARIDTPRLVLISFFLLQHSTRAKSWAVGWIRRSVAFESVPGADWVDIVTHPSRAPAQGHCRRLWRQTLPPIQARCCPKARNL